jgi:hypothetical protein
MAWSGLKLFLCVDTYSPTAFAMSARHDPPPRMSDVFANSAIIANFQLIQLRTNRAGQIDRRVIRRFTEPTPLC